MAEGLCSSCRKEWARDMGRGREPDIARQIMQMGNSKREINTGRQLRAGSLIGIASFICLCGCITCFLFGCVLTAASWIINRGLMGRELRDLGTLLILMIIPLMVGIGFCLDRLDSVRMRERAIEKGKAAGED